MNKIFSKEIQKKLKLSDETIETIQEALESKVDLAVEAALGEQDEVYAKRLINLIKTTDKDRTLKMRKMLEAVDKDKTSKLIKVIKKYEREQRNELHTFKKQLTEGVSEFLDEYIDESVPKEEISEAVKNKTAMGVLGNLRKVLAIDSAVMKESVSGAISEGKQELDKLRDKVVKLEEQNKQLAQAKNKSDIKLFIEGRTAKFQTEKKNFVTKALSDKSLEFIKENFDYTVRMFERQEKKQLETIKEEAIQNRKHKPDFVKEEKVITEKVSNDNEDANPYLEALQSMHFKR